VWGNPDTSPNAIIDQNVPRQQVLGDLVAVRDIDGNCSASPGRVAGSADVVPAGVGKLDQAGSLAHAFGPDCVDPDASEDLRTFGGGVERRNHRSSIQPPE